MITSTDIPLQVVSDNSRSERRISPAWTISQLKTKLEPITGVPASSQRLLLKTTGVGSGGLRDLSQVAEETQLAALGVEQAVEIQVIDTRPATLRENYTDVSAVDKYEMPAAEYEARTDSVLAWKRAQKLGRFDPSAPGVEEQKVRALQREVDERGIKVGLRCQLHPSTSDGRRGNVAYVGAVAEIPLGPAGGAWVGVALDEPSGKNDGAVEGKRYFTCPPKCGVFVRPERVEVGDFPALDEFADEEF